MSNSKSKDTEKEIVNASETLDNLKLMWSKSGKLISAILGILVVIVGGYFAYKQFVLKPKEAQALDKSFKAEEYYRLDSVNLALNGDGVNPGFAKIADNYSGTETGNLAKFYAGVCYIRLNQNDKAIKYLEDFSTNAKQVQQRAYLLLGDAYGDKGNGSKALDYYKKAGHYFETDQQTSSEALFRAAYLAQHVLNKKEEAVSLYKELKEKYPRTQMGFSADKYLAQLGVYNVD